MFTGLVETKGTLVRRAKLGRDARLTVRGDLAGEPVVLGESIAIDGVCLTVAKINAAGNPGSTVFEVDASSETLERTTLGYLAEGADVNLERALAVGARLGGHIVSGHVDGVGHVVSLTPVGEAVKVVFEAPAELGRFIAPKGSITVSGVSLTVNGIDGAAFDVMLIPHTRERTSLGALGAGAKVNLEVDLLARYVARLLESRDTNLGTTDARLLERLRSSGYA
jgi:riboflavin synthase